MMNGAAVRVAANNDSEIAEFVRTLKDLLPIVSRGQAPRTSVVPRRSGASRPLHCVVGKENIICSDRWEWLSC